MRADMNQRIKTESVDFLFESFLSVKSKDECYELFDDLCTVKEILSLAQRLEVAKMLRDNKTYIEITEHTGASAATISRVNRSLNYGNEAMDMVLERIKRGECVIAK